MFKKIAFIAVVVSLFSGCASVPMASQALSDQAKQFNPPPEGKAGLYIYRDSNFGSLLKKDIWVDGECVGESAPKVFFYKAVAGDKDHTISTESEFSPNALKISTKSGINYFIRQHIKFGVFVGGANLEVVDAAKAKEAIQDLGMAKGGTCSK